MNHQNDEHGGTAEIAGLEAAIDESVNEQLTGEQTNPNVARPQLRAVGTPAPTEPPAAAVAVSEAHAARESLKQRIKFAYAAAVRDKDYAVKAIADIEAAIAMQRLTVEGLRTMADEATERLRNARVAMAALQQE